MKRSPIRLLLLLLIVSLACVPAFTQIESGTVNATVTDSSGGAVAGAKVVITDTGTCAMQLVTRSTLRHQNTSAFISIIWIAGRDESIA